MATPFLKRSVETFRRSGSSGSVWDDRYSENMGVGESKAEAAEFMELRHAHSVGAMGQAEYRFYNDGPHLSRSGTASPASHNLPRRSLLGCIGNRHPKSLPKETKTLRVPR